MVDAFTDLIGTVVAQTAKFTMITAPMATIPQHFVRFFIEPPLMRPAVRLDKFFPPSRAGIKNLGFQHFYI
jgi:hypothetical protein